MTDTRKARLGLLAASCLALGGCGVSGKVNQGMVVAYDASRGIVTLISESSPANPANPSYDVVPAVDVRIPADPAEMGPAPEPGGLLNLEIETGKALIYDPASRGTRVITVTVERQERVFGDDPRVVGRRHPVIDRGQGTVTTYLGRRQVLVTLKLAPELLELPSETWRPGDEVRYYYKDPGQALRMMNVTRTDLNKAGK